MMPKMSGHRLTGSERDAEQVRSMLAWIEDELDAIDRGRHADVRVREFLFVRLLDMRVVLRGGSDQDAEHERAAFDAFVVGLGGNADEALHVLLARKGRLAEHAKLLGEFRHQRRESPR